MSVTSSAIRAATKSPSRRVERDSTQYDVLNATTVKAALKRVYRLIVAGRNNVAVAPNRGMYAGRTAYIPRVEGKRI